MPASLDAYFRRFNYRESNNSCESNYHDNEGPGNGGSNETDRHNSTSHHAAERKIVMANLDQLGILKRGVSEWNNWRSKNTSVLPDLSGAALKGANLSGANFTKANLRSADLSNANLSRANLSKADLTKADLNGALLDGATGLTWQGRDE